MSRIDELIAAECPSGVKFVPLSSVARIRNGRDYKHLSCGDVPVYGSGGVMTSVDAAAFEGPSVLIPRKGSLGNLFYVEGAFWTVDTIFYTEIDTLQIAPKFLYYFLGTLGLGQMNQAGGVPSQTQSVLNRLRIALPPMAVQREIVAILDAFTELEAELEAELETRRTQFYWYRDELLKFEAKAERQVAPFGHLATIVRGGSPRPIQSFLTKDKDGVNWIKIGDVPAEGKYVTSTAQRIRREGARRSRSVGPGDFILSNSMSFGRPYIVKINGCIHDGWLAIQDFEARFDANYLYHLLRSRQVAQTLAMKAGSGTVQNLNADIVKALQLPIVPLEEQRRVAEVLDAFEALVGDIRVGLPAELAARRKQYEYYRDRLLTFSEAS